MLSRLEDSARREYRDRLIEVALRDFASRASRAASGRQVDEEAIKIERCRTDLASWAVEAQRQHGWKPAKHHRYLIRGLERVAAGKCPRLMVFMPPGSAKSSYASQIFPAWMFQRRPGIRIVGASHTSPLAMDFSAMIQQLVRDNEETLGYELQTENKARWYTTNGGSYLAAGVGNAIPGYRADLGILDDPVKSRMAADSEVDRKRVWDWYIGSFERRLTPNAPVILILTRWHEDDLAGRLLETQRDKWEVISLPAEAEEDDLLGRSPGEWLWSDDSYGFGATLPGIKHDLESAGATREWASQYQQHPRPSEGAIFIVGRVGVLPAVPEGGKKTVRAYDLAATRDVGTRDPAWTRGVKLTMLSSKRVVVEDVVGCRGGPEEVERLIVNTAAQDGKSVKIGLPQDPGQAGKSQVMYLTKLLHGYRVETSPETGDKATRAGPIASQVNVGNVDMVEGSWNRSFLDEIGGFPSGAHSDQVDALSRAYSMLLEAGQPYVLSPGALMRHANMANTRDRFARAR